MFYESNQIRATKASWILRSLVLLACLATALPMMASWSQSQKITSIPRGVGAQFGNAVALNGSTMVVGARHDSTTASQAGAAFVYVLNGGTWTQQAVLLAPDGALADKFGQSVAISQDTIVVGSYNDDTGFSNGGSAYVFVRSGTTWTFQQKLTPAIMAADDEFGNAVGITGDSIIVGAHFADLPSNSDAGAAYVFQRSGTVWTELQKLTPTAGTNGTIGADYFGESVAMSGGRVIIGAMGDDSPETAAGAVYVFTESGGLYGLQQKLTISSGTNGDRFGSSVAIEGNTLVGGAREDTPFVGQTARGSAYVYEFNGSTWVSQGRLLASDGASFDRFGWSVAVSNNVIAVGAREDDTVVGPDAGSAYVYTRSGTFWNERQKLAPTDPFNGDRFGSGVALSFGNLVVGAAEKALTAPNGQGAAYYFKLPPKVKFDFDGDGIADISIFRPTNGQWWYQQSSNNSVRATTSGNSTDKPVPADFDDDGKTDIAFYRPSTGEWFVLRSSNSTFFSVPFGVSTDKPAPGDYDGDGFADVAVFRASEGTWFISKPAGGTQITQWGLSGDVPVNADYDGDGKCDVAIFRPSTGVWWILRSSNGQSFSTAFGVSTDKPVPADYTGDGKTDIAVWRPANGTWYVLRSEDSSFFAVPFGTNGDIPAAADFDGDRKADFGVFRPDGANWFVQRSTADILIQQFGLTGDLPTQAAFIP